MKNRYLFITFLSFLVLMLISLFSQPKERMFFWIAESLPLLIGFFILFKNYKTFPLSLFTYIAIFIYGFIMLIGSQYGYSNIPFCEIIKNYFNFERNNYDKVSHFFQGFTIAILAKDIIIMKKIINIKKWVNYFSFSISITIAGAWEVLEWLYVVIITHFNVEEPSIGFLGEQNYYWDTQSDIFAAIIGAYIAIKLFNINHAGTIKK